MMEVEVKRMKETRLLTPKEVAEILGVSEQTLARYRAQDTGPRWIKLGESRTSPIRYLPLTVAVRERAK
jgi:predicted DNA-binding transcriptional regulator AlpA